MGRRVWAVCSAVLLFGMLLGTSWAGDTASVELGKKLFSDPGLGGAGKTKSCSTCHPNGKGLAQAGAKANLAEIINACISSALGGKKLDPKSVEIESLILYIKSLGTK